MAATLVWSPEALEDLELIAEYIERDSAFYASAVVGKLVAKARDIAEFPDSGRVVPEFKDPTLREAFVYSYRLVYQSGDDTVLIVAVVHGKRLLENSGRFE
ncbi:MULTISPECIES: type II toxin-antitoxin system RelE/ParE family toxin [unclassified Halomonas]|uniref:type II toxin-antitoxin system RelE/ParE family toxin n=1 Tax=unclassified Halomonas TaxID=2609666 RepID=UPI0004AC70DB|nr:MULTISPECIES: type II toxin-antitoxin system RelE/ParE family toxin [unclassified Halomonas]